MENVEIKHLRSFVMLEKTRSFKTAARRLHITTSALSQQMRRLEDVELKIKLFERGRHGVHLTHAGEQLSRYAPRVLQEHDVAEQALSHAGVLRVAYSASHRELVANAVAMAMQKIPEMRAELREMTAFKVESNVLDGSVDVGLSYAWQPSQGIDVELVVRTPLRLIVPTGHRLCKKRRITSLAELTDEHFALLRPGLRARRTLDKYISANGKFVPKIKFESNRVGIILSFVALGSAITVLPVPVLDLVPRGLGLEILDLPNADEQESNLLWRTGLPETPAAAAFADAVQSQLGHKRRRKAGVSGPLPTHLVK